MMNLLSGLLLLAAAPAQTIDVWPGPAPGEKGDIGEEKTDGNKPGQPTFVRVTNVTKPTLTVFPAPEGKNTGAAVVICPGGGYRVLMMDYEGTDVAKWLNGLGVTGIVLKYRVPAREGQPRHLAALQDAQRAMSLVRSKAKEWGVAGDRIGILGFSAGGHLSAATSTNYEKRSYEAIDEVDRVSCRPDFAVVIYPGGMIDKETGALTDVFRVAGETPPTFMAMSHEDRVNTENCIRYYLALKKAGVSTELHIFATGKHGWGMRPGDRPENRWIDRCEEWMKVRGILK